MRLLLDDIPTNGGSDAGFDPIGTADEQFFSDDQQQHFEGETYGSGGTNDSEDPGSTQSPESAKRKSLIAEAKRGIARGRATAQRTVPKRIGEALGDKQMFMQDTEEGRERTKEIVKGKARDYAKDKIGSKIADEGIKKGLEKGLSKGATKLAGEGAKKAGQAVAEKAGKKLAQEGVKQLAGKGVGTAVGAATGVETFGLGFLLGFLINIAISLGVSDAVDGMFELKDGNFKQAKFLVIRGGAKVGMFVYLLITLVMMTSVGGIFIAVPLLVFLNIYMLLGFAFRKIAQFQGLVWWEIAMVIFLDVMAVLILLAFLGALGWYLCGEGAISNTVIGVAATIYDWWNKGSIGSVAADFCTFINITNGTAVPPVQ